MVNVDIVGVSMFNASGTLIDCNDTFLGMFGYTREDVTAGKLTRRTMTPPEFFAIGEPWAQKEGEPGPVGPYEKEYVRKDGSRRSFVFVGAALGDGTTIEYCFDISDRKQAQELVATADRNLKVVNDALVTANSDLKHFSYAVSHDMQEPLRMVTSYTQLLARDYAGKLGADADEYIGFAVRGARQMESLLNDLRDYWAVDEQKEQDVVSVDLNAVLDRVLGYLQTSIDQSKAVISRETLPTVIAETYPLTLLFQNLIGNAIKYQVPDVTPFIHISSERMNGQWVFSVTDNGIGIAQEDLQNIFAPFKRLHVIKQPGSGLGLTMCEKIIRRYRGRISVQSEPGKGSTFRFTLPVTDVPHENG
jgi:PAS domain S-box-containing protein